MKPASPHKSTAPSDLPTQRLEISDRTRRIEWIPPKDPRLTVTPAGPPPRDHQVLRHLGTGVALLSLLLLCMWGWLNAHPGAEAGSSPKERFARSEAPSSFSPTGSLVSAAHWQNAGHRPVTSASLAPNLSFPIPPAAPRPSGGDVFSLGP